MTVSLNINDILSQIKRLDKEDQLILLQKLVLMLKRTEATKDTSVNLTTLPGLGRDIWKSTNDIDNYVDGERQW